MVSALQRKLARDLRQLRGQVLTVALVVASGIASYVTTVATYRSLGHSQRAYYERARFADVFARFERAPESVLSRLAMLPGVARVESRVVEDVLLDLPDLPEPALGRLVSIPEQGEPALNRLHLREGRLPEPGRALEVLVSEAFATAHGLHPGAQVRAVLNGRLTALEVVGVGISPEYIYAVGPQSMLDDNKRFGVFWMRRRALAAAFRMEGAFDDAVLKLEPGARSEEVVAAVDRLLARYGGPGAQPREKQTSHRFVVNELNGLKVQATIVPLIFLGVAAFLVNVVLGRLVGTQRSEIATLKALGYGDRAIGAHYLALVLVMVGLGALLGVGLGAWLGAGLTEIYREVFHFPSVDFVVDPDVVAVAVGVSALSAVAGAAASVVRVARLPPAEAMRPESPPVYRATLSERLGVAGWLSPAARMVVRELERRPLRLFASVLGIALAVAILVDGRFSMDSVDYLMELQFEQLQREQLTLTFVEPVPERALRELEQLPGVRLAEGLRAVPVRFRAGHRSYESAIQGFSAQGTLRRVLGPGRRTAPLPPEGLLLGSELAKRLGVGAGDAVELELLEEERRHLLTPVAAVVEEMVGVSAYMDRRALSRLLGEEQRVSGAALAVDPAQLDALYA
ncbi:MAG TPA: ABC transporter permease, partial [Aggregicoccus sp.]|nr:ABC transporter permease [Aggregicoccus sp.]